MEWSLSNELCAMLSVSSLSESLARIIPTESVTDATVRERFGWARRGGESYTYAFDVLGVGKARSYLLKALVPSVGTHTVEGATEIYLRNMDSLREGGVLVPRVYAVHRGMLLMDYVPCAALDALRD